MKINYTNVNFTKLHDELIKSGITPLSVTSLNGTTTIIYADNVDVNKVNEVVTKHINTIDPIQVPLLESNRADIVYLALMTGVTL